MTAIIKRYPVFLACLALVAILIASSTWHCSHKGKSGTRTTSPSPSLIPSPSATEPATDTTSPGIDWVLISNAIGTLIAAIVGVWDLARKMFPGAVKVAGLSPSAEALGDALVVIAADTGFVGSGAEFELGMRVMAEKLLTKYVITVRGGTP